MLYVLMNKKKSILKCDIDGSGHIDKVVELCDLNYMPPGIPLINGYPDKKILNKWWENRVIPSSREGLRYALQEMNIEDEKELAVKSYGLSLSDQYWINPVISPQEWEKINFFNHTFSNYVGERLFGSAKSTVNPEDILSPCSTSNGYLKKKWVVGADDKRYLVKGGSGSYLQEPYNEVLATIIHKRLNIMPWVEYSLIYEDNRPYSVCKNFITEDTELVPGYFFLSTAKKSNDVSYFEHFIMLAEQAGITYARRFLEYLITTDYLIGNTDRHFNNLGLIRNAETLKYVGMAPIYDNGNSMWFNVSTARIDLCADMEAMPWRNSQEKQIELVHSFEGIELDKLKGVPEEYNELLKGSIDISPNRRDLLLKGLEKRIELLQDHVVKKSNIRHSNDNLLIKK